MTGTSLTLTPVDGSYAYSLFPFHNLAFFVSFNNYHMSLTGHSSETESESPHPDDCAVSGWDKTIFPVWDPRHPDWSTPLPLEVDVVKQDIQILLDFDLARFNVSVPSTQFSATYLLGCHRTCRTSMTYCSLRRVFSNT